MAFQTRDVIQAIQALGFPIQELRVDGGATHNQFLMQFQADILGIPVERSTMSDITALGAAGVAGISSGFWTDAEFDQLKQHAQLYTPSMDETQRNALYQGWQHAVAQCLKV
jgi:glycerol kinase